MGRYRPKFLMYRLVISVLKIVGVPPQAGNFAAYGLSWGLEFLGAATELVKLEKCETSHGTNKKKTFNLQLFLHFNTDY